MIKTISTIAKHEFLAVWRQKTFLLILLLFLSMTLLSTYIGWSTKQTIIEIYNETISRLVQGGVTEIPVNPFLHLPALGFLKNMTIYVVLIGSLMAMILGHSAFIRERKAGVVKLLFSRSLSPYQFAAGKILGIFSILLVVISSSFFISYLSASLVSGTWLHLPETTRLIAFYTLSFEYILTFALVSFWFSIVTRRESLALMIPFIIWIIIVFVLPQLNTALDPASLLNPTTIQTAFPQGKFFTAIRDYITPFSLSESYRFMGKQILENGQYSIWLLPSMLSNILLTILSFYSMKRFNFCEEEIQE